MHLPVVQARSVSDRDLTRAAVTIYVGVSVADKMLFAVLKLDFA